MGEGRGSLQTAAYALEAPARESPTEPAEEAEGARERTSTEQPPSRGSRRIRLDR